MRFLVQPDGVYLVFSEGNAMLLPGVTYDLQRTRVDITAVPVDIAIDGIVVDGAKELRVTAGVQLVVFADNSTATATEVVVAAQRVGSRHVDVDKVRGGG